MNKKYLKVVRYLLTQSTILIIAWCGFFACDQTDAVEETIAAETLCNGESELWIGYQRFAGMGEGGAGFSLFEENGRVYFVIDESCRYFAFDGTDGAAEYNDLADIRTGILTKNEAADIANRLKMPRWSNLIGNRYSDEAIDCGGSAVFDKTGAFYCDNADDIYQIFLRDYIPIEDKDGLLQPHDLSALKTIEP